MAATDKYRRTGTVTVELTVAEANAVQLAITNMVESGNPITKWDREAIRAGEKIQRAWRKKANS